MMSSSDTADQMTLTVDTMNAMAALAISSTGTRIPTAVCGVNVSDQLLARGDCETAVDYVPCS